MMSSIQLGSNILPHWLVGTIVLKFSFHPFFLLKCHRFFVL